MKFVRSPCCPAPTKGEEVEISCQAALVKIVKVEPNNSFVAIDLEQCNRSVGLVRQARKVLQSSAKDLARSLTYGFASFEIPVGGASAGISAEAKESEKAILDFVSAVAPMVEAGTFLPSPGKGVSEASLASLRTLDSRSPLLFETSGDFMAELEARSVAATVDAALDGVEGKTVAIEGFDGSAVHLARALSERGAKLTAISTAAGVAQSSAGFATDALSDAANEFGPTLVEHLGGEETDATGSIWTAEVDVIIPRSKIGVINHGVADQIFAPVIVPGAPLPITAKALAHLRRAGKAAYPDFVSLGGPIVGSWPSATASLDSIRGDVDTQVTALVDDIKHHPDGPLLAACYRAETFLNTWQETLPFGRPLAP